MLADPAATAGDPFRRRVKRRFSRWNRERKAAWLTRFVGSEGVRTVIVIGIGRRRFPNEGIVEDRLAECAQIVAACDIVQRSTPWPTVVCDGRSLPFRAGAVDLVMSNAVVEHVGAEADQRALVDEQARVGRRWVLTTPNRWFPVESHTSVVLRHWSARWRASHAAVFTRLLSRSEFSRLLPPQAKVEGSLLAPTFLAHGAGSRTGVEGG